MSDKLHRESMIRRRVHAVLKHPGVVPTLVYLVGITLRVAYTFAFHRPEKFVDSDMSLYVDLARRLLAAGAILRHAPLDDAEGEVIEGARTTAAIAASRFGPVLKVSEDGVITYFDREQVWEI